jgi:hypothetical protein
VITNEKKSTNSLKIISDFNNITHRIKKRQFSEANVQEFFYLLNQVTWQEVYVELDIIQNLIPSWMYFFIVIMMHFQLKQYM